MSDLNKFEAWAADALPISCGFSFKADDIDNIMLFKNALMSISGVVDVETGEPNKYGIVSVHYTPVTRVAYAVCNSIVAAFKKNASGLY